MFFLFTGYLKVRFSLVKRAMFLPCTLPYKYQFKKQLFCSYFHLTYSLCTSHYITKRRRNTVIWLRLLESPKIYFACYAFGQACAALTACTSDAIDACDRRVTVYLAIAKWEHFCPCDCYHTFTTMKQKKRKVFIFLKLKEMILKMLFLNFRRVHF